MATHKRSKKQLLQLFTQYGVHLWAILLIANVALVYSYHLATHAATNDTSGPVPSITLSQAPSTSVSPSQQPSAPAGQSISLTFSVPGIGSGGGVLKPLHPTRNVTVFLYATDANSLDPGVNPLYTIKSTATYDSNAADPTYTNFINPDLNLGTSVQDGNYQIAFKTDQSLRTLIKANPTDIGGEIFAIAQDASPIIIPIQTVLMGDTIPPQGDNLININDYNAFISCYGDLNKTNPFCSNGNYGDFNDDGVIDGIDYNILLRSLNVLAQEGIAVPQISPTPTKIQHPTHHPKPTIPLKKPTATPAASQNNTNASGGILLFLLLFFILLLGGAGVVLYFKNSTIHDYINALIHLSPTGKPSPELTGEKPETPEQTPQATLVVPEASGETIEKDCFVKKKGQDESGKGLWLQLTDDNGPIEAHYAKTDAIEGFAKVKGVMKTENGKKFLEILEISAED